MWPTFQHFVRFLSGKNRRKTSPRPRVSTFRPRLEALEDRTLLSAYIVTTTADSGAGSLRDAITQVNADTSHALYASPSNPSVDEIDFNVTAASDTGGGFNSITGVATIKPQSVLPSITNSVIIDGYTESSASANTLTNGENAVLKIMLDGSNAGAGVGLELGSDCTVRGLAIGNFIQSPPFLPAAGIQTDGDNNTIQGCYLGLDPSGETAAPNGVGISDYASGTTIGGTNPSERNVISGSGQANVASRGNGVTIQGNFIGTDATGTAAMFGDVGINLGNDTRDDPMNTIADNLISGNISDGILLGNINHVRIVGNLIGTDATGMHALGNSGTALSDGIVVGVGVTDLVIGGTDPGSRNVISASSRSGIWLPGSGAVVQGNYIGTDVTGAPTLGNGGEGIEASSNCLIGGTDPGAGNLIAGNLGAGVGCNGSNDQVIGNVIHDNSDAGVGNGGTNDQVIGNVIHDNGGAGVAINGGAQGNTLSANSIYANTSLGIDLEPTNPSTGNFVTGVTLNDSVGHDGPNHFQNFPILTAANGASATGTLISTPNTTFRIEFFANTQADPSGYGEGERYIGFIDVTTDDAGNASFDAPIDALLAGETYLTATATNRTTGDTSEFSNAVAVETSPTAVVGGPYSIQEGQSLTLSGTGSYSPSGGTLTYAWDVNGAGTFTAATGASPTLTWAQLQALGVTEEGTFSVQLRVTDSNGNTATSSPVSLTVTDAPLTASGRSVAPTAGAPFSGVLATFTDADPAGVLGDYSASITWGDGTTSTGIIGSNGSGDFTVTGSHTYAAAKSYAVSVTINDIGGSTVTANSTANVANLGQGVQSGQGPGIGFWHNKNGQALLDAFNGGPNSTDLANWLASTFPNLYGANAGADNLTGETNAQVAAFDLTLFSESGPKLDAQVLAAALNVYATTQSLGGTTGQSYGFLVNAFGLGADSYNVGSNGPAFGVPNNTTLNVYEILLAANQQANNGLLYNGNATLDNEANNVFSGINQAGGI